MTIDSSKIYTEKLLSSVSESSLFFKKNKKHISLSTIYLMLQISQQLIVAF